MSESRKSPRPKGPRAAGKGSSSGWSTSKPGGKSGPKADGDRRSGPPKGPGKGPARGPAKGPAKSRSGKPDERKPSERKPSGGKPDNRKPSGGKPFRDAPAPAKKTPRVDDFDFDIDRSLDPDAAPAPFPQPARPAKGYAGKPGDRFEKSGKPGAPARSGKPAPRFEKSDRPTRPAAPHASAERPESPEGEDGKSVTAGRNPVRELLESAPRRIDNVFVRKGQRDAKVQEIVALADENRIKVQFVDDAALRRLFSGTHQGVVAVTSAVEYADLDALIKSVASAPLPVLIALDQVQDPGNLGAIARTAWALGAAGIIVPRHGGSYIGAGAMRASAGALHHLPVARVTNMSQTLDACAEAGLTILCADAEGEDLNKAALDLPAVLVLGGEEKGVRFGVGKHCQKKLAIPLKRAFDSLNVAQAAAICLARLGQL